MTKENKYYTSTQIATSRRGSLLIKTTLRDVKKKYCTISVNFTTRNKYLEVGFIGEDYLEDACGQCDSTISANTKYPRKKMRPLLHAWKKYHLNAMSAYTPAQQEILKKQGRDLDFTAACEVLKAEGMYEVEFTATDTEFIYGRCEKSGDTIRFRAGNGWWHIRLTDQDLKEILEAAIQDSPHFDAPSVRERCLKTIRDLEDCIDKPWLLDGYDKFWDAEVSAYRGEAHGFGDS